MNSKKQGSYELYMTPDGHWFVEIYDAGGNRIRTSGYFKTPSEAINDVPIFKVK